MPYEVNIKETQKLTGNITISQPGTSFTSFTHEIWTFTLEDDTTVEKDVMLYVNE